MVCLCHSKMNLSQQIHKLRSAIDQAELIIIGAGSGLSSASGLSFDDTANFNTLFPSYRESYDLQTINQALFHKFSIPEEQYAFWTHLITKIRYNHPAEKPYLDLHRIMENKKHFIITTNIDGQFLKSGFLPDNLCTPQGALSFFQCSRPCNTEIYHNEQMINAMLPHMADNPFILPAEYIPHCQKCGSPLIPNIRNSSNFVEKPWIAIYQNENDLIRNHRGKKILLLELGVGVNTPEIIRYPFEHLVLQRKNTTMIRINMNLNHLTLLNNSENAVLMQADIGLVLAELAKAY